MTIFPIRDVAKYGIITDQDPYDIPTEAWSLGVNVRFQNRKVTRGPVWRAAQQPLGTANPRFVVGNTFNTGQDNLFVGYLNGTVSKVLNGTETAYSPATYTPSSSDSIWTTTTLANVLWVNRSDRAPWFLRASDAAFQNFTLATSASTATSSAVLTFASVPSWVAVGMSVIDANNPAAINAGQTVLSVTSTTVTLTANVNATVNSGDLIFFSAWPANTMCGILRSVAGALCAYNITQNGVAYPTRLLTSNFPTAGSIPSTFLPTIGGNPTGATDNILPEFQGAILDACPLGNNMYIYGENEVWFQTPVGGTEIWNYFLAFDNRGVINSNCVVEFNGNHYVFGTDDIWMHNGTLPVSICTDRVRDFIFGNINANFANRCHVRINRALQEIMFCFRSSDSLTKYPASTDGCNRSATYDIPRDRWTFDDAPCVMFGGRANLDNSMEWSTAPLNLSWSTAGGSWSSLDDTFRKSTVYVGIADSGDGLQNTLYAFDPAGPLSQVTYPIDTNATQPSYLQRDGIDLDQVGVDLKGYKICQSIYPQGRLAAGAAPLQFSFGSADYFNHAPQYSAYQTWDGNTLYKLDFGIAGRYLSMQVLFSDINFFSLTGFDLDLDVFGER